jgi:ribonuclease BN (tRNA processing enzyme)
MRFRVLGCSGGFGDGRHTTSFLIDDDILLDAGSGVSRLTRVEMARIDHVFITHSHLDHVLSLPLLIDTVANERNKPLQVHAIPEVLEILKDHIFNWRIWPDFSRIPTVKAPFLVFVPLPMGQTLSLPDATGSKREFTPIPAYHVVPTSGYRLSSEHGSLLFSGDTGSHSALWEQVAATPDLRHLLVECSYACAQSDIASASRHFYTAELAADLTGLTLDAEIWITHLKPGAEDEIMVELHALLTLEMAKSVHRLIEGQTLEI